MRPWNLNFLLIFIPFAVWLYYFTKASPLLVFAMAAITIVPLSKIVGSAAQTLGVYLGADARWALERVDGQRS